MKKILKRLKNGCIFMLVLISLVSFVSAHTENEFTHHGMMGTTWNGMSGMMGFGGIGMWLFGSIIALLIITVLILLIVWSVKQINKN